MKKIENVSGILFYAILIGLTMVQLYIYALTPEPKKSYGAVRIDTAFISTPLHVVQENNICNNDDNETVVNELDTLILAMIEVESKGKDSAYNAKENAVGCLQIRPICVKDINRILEKKGDTTTYELSDRWSREKSIEMFMVIYSYYHEPYNHSYEQIARCWNGGPHGDEYSGTIGYWNKVQTELQDIYNK